VWAIATDTTGNQTQSAKISFTVADKTPPTVSITNPLNGSSVARNATVTIAASAQDASGVKKVEFYVNGSLSCTTTAAPYTCNWTVPHKAGASYTLLAKAYDPAGNIGTASVVVTSR
jgi:hypothetical protein